VREVLEVGAQVASALSAAHAAGILHRDIKPENLMMRRDGYVKVLDFGLAKLIEPASAAGQPTAGLQGFQTIPGLMMGTVSYMSPEQVKGLEVDARSDIFGLGVVLYELIAKKTPFPGATVAAVAAEILHAQPQPLQTSLRGVSAELERIVAKALAKDREHRYQSAKDLFIDLKNLSVEFEVETRLRRSPGPAADPDSARQPSARSSPESERDFALPLRSGTSRFLFLLIQLGYLAMYCAVLQYADEMGAVLTVLDLTPVAVTLPLLMILAMCGIAVRLYLLSAVGWGHPAAGIQFGRLFPILLVLDGVWAASPLLAARKLGIGTALAGIAGLAYLPFAQRTLIQSIYRRAPD
jgi:serine/threonine protein kinase